MPRRGTGWSVRSSKMDEGLVVAIGTPKILDEAVAEGLTGSLDIVVAGLRVVSRAVGLGIECVRSGTASDLPLVSRVVTIKPVVSGLELLAVGGICTITEDFVTVITPAAW